jgi:hypothetical protein
MDDWLIPVASRNTTVGDLFVQFVDDQWSATFAGDAHVSEALVSDAAAIRTTLGGSAPVVLSTAQRFGWVVIGVAGSRPAGVFVNYSGGLGVSDYPQAGKLYQGTDLIRYLR